MEKDAKVYLELKAGKFQKNKVFEVFSNMKEMDSKREIEIGKILEKSLRKSFKFPEGSSNGNNLENTLGSELNPGPSRILGKSSSGNYFEFPLKSNHSQNGSHVLRGSEYKVMGMCSDMRKSRPHSLSKNSYHSKYLLKKSLSLEKHTTDNQVHRKWARNPHYKSNSKWVRRKHQTNKDSKSNLGIQSNYGVRNGDMSGGSSQQRRSRCNGFFSDQKYQNPSQVQFDLVKFIKEGRQLSRRNISPKMGTLGFGNDFNMMIYICLYYRYV